MKIYARQVEPEYQESPYYMFKDEDCYNEIIVTGNRRFIGKKTEEFKTIENYIDDAYYELCGIGADSNFNNITELVNHYFPPCHKKAYSTKEIKRWRDALTYIVENENVENYYCEMLSLYTGIEYSYADIRGCSQGDWNGLYYPTSYSDDFVKTFEIEYFNTGTEVIIHDEEFEPENEEDISGYALYCYTYDIKKEIAEHCNVAEDDVIFYEVCGYSRRANYTKT